VISGIRWLADPILLASNGSIVNVKSIVCGKEMLKYRRSDPTNPTELSDWLVTLNLTINSNYVMMFQEFCLKTSDNASKDS
jgi:hypothetical protein